MIRRPNQEASFNAMRNVEEALTPGGQNSEAVASGGMRSVLESVSQREIELGEAKEWAREGINTALQSWQQVESALREIPMPVDMDQLLELHKHPEEVLTRLHETCQELDRIGAQMDIVLIPWHAFRGVTNLAELQGTLGELLRARRTSSQPSLSVALTSNCHAIPPRYTLPEGNQILKMSDYIEHKYEEDGPWGIMLVETSQHTRLSLSDEPETEERLKVLDIDASSMGVYEYVSMMTQANSSQLSFRYDSATLPANSVGIAKPIQSSSNDGIDGRTIDWKIHIKGSDPFGNSLGPRMAVS